MITRLLIKWLLKQRDVRLAHKATKHVIMHSKIVFEMYACFLFFLIKDNSCLRYVPLHTIGFTTLFSFFNCHKIRVLIISIIHQSFIFILFVLNFRWPFSSSFGRTMERFWRRLHQRKLHKGSMFSFIISQSKKYTIIMLDILWNTYLLIRKWNKCFILNVLEFQRWEALSCSSR